MNILTRLLAVAAIFVYAGAAQAQVGPQLTQTASRADAATGLFGSAGGAATCNTVNSTVANGTVTITPPGGNYVYIAGVYIDITSDTTGTTGVATMSTTNLTGGPFWSLATLLTGNQTSGVMANMRQISESYATPLKSTVPGTNVTFVPSAQIADTIVCTRVLAYFAP